MNEYLGSIGETMTIKIMPLIPAFVEAVKDIMQQHGGSLEVHNGFCIAFFPAGTLKEEVSQLRVHDVRYTITFPDGYTVWETVGRDKLHTIEFTLSDFPDALRMRYKHLIETRSRND